MKLGQAEVDFEALLIESSVGSFSMESKVMAVLGVLVENANKVMSRDDLIDMVWGVEFGGDDRLYRAISVLRKALGDVRGQHNHIETIPRRGYRLIAKLGDDCEVDHLAAVQKKLSAIPVEAIQISPLAPPVIKPSTISVPSVEMSNIPQKRRFGIRSFVALSVVMVALLALWISPIGNTIANIPQNNRVEAGLEYVKNFTRKDAIPQAQVLFSNILVDNPDHAAARAGLALALMREYTYLETDPALLHRAKSAAEASYRTDRHLALASIAVGWAAEYEGDFQKAHKSYDRADILDPNNIFTLEGRARTYNKQGKRDEAKKIVDMAISLYPNYALFYSYSGQILIAENDYAHAEAMFRHVITLSDDNPRAYAQLAQSLHLQDRTAIAISTLQDGLKVNETAPLYSNLGTYLFFQGHYEMAAQAFKRALEFDGNSHDYLYWANLGDAYRWMPGKSTEANTAYDRALQLLQIELDKRPMLPSFNSRAALYNAKRGHLDRARMSLAHVLTGSSNSANEYYRAAVTYEILAERHQALTMLEHALNAGYPLTEILNDPELASLRQDLNYHRLLTTLNMKKEN